MQRAFGLAAIVLASALVVWGVARGKGPARAVEPIGSSATESAAGLETRSALAPASSPELEASTREEVAATEAAGGAARAWIRVCLTALETGAPLPGVRCQLGHRIGPNRIWYLPSSSGKECEALVSGADGCVEFAVRSGVPYELSVNVDGAAHVGSADSDVTELSAGERRELVLELPTRDDLVWFARIVEDASGEPIAGARVAWLGGARSGSPPVFSAADGIVRLNFASFDPARVSIEREAYCQLQRSLSPGFERPDRAQVIRLPKPASLSVSVLDEAGAPLPDSEIAVQIVPASEALPDSVVSRALSEKGNVILYSEGAIGLQAVAVQGRTDEHGTCRFDGLPPRADGTVVARRPSEPSQRQKIRLEPAELRALTFQFGSPCRVLGLVQDAEGRPVRDLDLWRLRGESVPAFLENSNESVVVEKARTNAEGRFTFERVPAGDWWIGAAPYERKDGAPVPFTTRVSVDPLERVHSLVLVCPGTRYLRGRVLGPAGRPASASVRAEQGNTRLDAPCDGQGRFVLGPVTPGAWSLVARPPEPSGEDWAHVGHDAPSERAWARAGTEDIVLRLRPGGALGGVVLDTAGAPVPHVAVTLWSKEEGQVQAAVASEHGRFALGGATAGRYWLWAHGDAGVGLLGPLTVEEGRTQAELVVVVRPAAVLNIALDTATPAGHRYRATWNEVPLREGTFSGRAARVTAPPGRIRCEILGPSGDEVHATREGELAAGDEVWFEFTLEPGPERR